MTSAFDILADLSEVPGDWLVPGVNIQVRADYSLAGILPFPAKILLVGQMLGSGAGTAGKVYPLVSSNQAAYLFGYGSIAHQVALRALAVCNWLPIDIVALADASGAVKATKTITVARAARESGVPRFRCAGQPVDVPINAATQSTVNATATAIRDAFNAVPSLPVTATATNAVVTLTARHGGAAGNDINIVAPNWPDSGAPYGFATAVAGGVTGTTDPDLSTVFSAISGLWYTDIIVPWTGATTLAVFSAELDRRYGAMVRLDARGYVACNNTYGSLPGMVSAPNGKLLFALGTQGNQSPSWEVAAAFGVACAAELYKDPARQMGTVVLPGIIPPDAADRFDETERNLLLHEGISTYGVTPDGRMLLERVVSTRLLTDLGITDRAWLDINAAAVPTRIRHDFRAYLADVWPRAKLADDDSLAARTNERVATPNRIKAVWQARSRLYEEAGWIEDSERLGRDAVFVRHPSERNTLLARVPIRRIGNLFNLAMDLAFLV